MSVANPETIEEWRQYISTLNELELFSKARAANTQKFNKTLLSEGYDNSEVHAILQAFAKRFVDLKLQPPSDGGVIDFVKAMGSPDVAKLKLPKGVIYEPEPDQIDRAVAEADLETEWDNVGG